MADANHYETGLDKNPANYVPLTPVTFLERSAAVYPDKIALIHGPLRQDWKTTLERCRRFASMLARHGVGVGDTVAVMAPNTPAMFEAHFAVPMAGAVLNTINIRLDADTVAFILRHGAAKVLLTDLEFSPVVRQALSLIPDGQRPLVVDLVDPVYSGPGERLGAFDYDALLAQGDPAFVARRPVDEWQAIALNYTSGTTGNPKGVVIHHRGAYLNAYSNAVESAMGHRSVYLWTLPMFHCNGWCYVWTMALASGTSVCLRKVETGPVFRAIREHGVTHMCGAPVVLNMLINAPEDERGLIGHPVEFLTGGAAPPAAVIARMEGMGIQVTHLYGLTETYGPSVVCAWHDEWDALPLEERARLKSRIGVRKATITECAVLDPDTLEPVPADGETIGEVMMRGNTVMRGYLRNPQATAEAFAGGWFHSGDLGVMHPDGYIQIRDRAKDIVISGGENISSLEVEDVLYRHPAVLEAAVVARPDEHWGETPCAFVTLKDGARASAEDIVAFCRSHLARFKLPKTIVFGPLPKTATGKIQKFVLRERARSLEPDGAPVHRAGPAVEGPGRS